MLSYPESDTPVFVRGLGVGKRTALEEKGFKFDFFYIADLEANPSGNLQQIKARWEKNSR
jgi:hypothetical protein